MSVLLQGRWLYLNLITIGFAVLLFLFWQQTAQQTTENQASLIPDYYLNAATVSQYDVNGALSSNISAERFTHIAESGTTDMLNPQFKIYLNAANTTWFGKADEGLILDSGAQINLTGNTLITTGKDTNRPFKLTSQSLKLYPQRNYAESDDQVTLTTQHSHLTGTGMQLTLDNQRLVFLHQVKATQSAPRN